MERFAAGSTAGAIAQTSIYPMEVKLEFAECSMYTVSSTSRYTSC